MAASQGRIFFDIMACVIVCAAVLRCLGELNCVAFHDSVCNGMLFSCILIGMSIESDASAVQRPTTIAAGFL
jgi:hypothetical protein